jgi:SAM-dependent methyltransferase
MSVESKACRQAERAARFWDEYYTEGESPPNTSESETVRSKCHEWICSPDEFLHLLPLPTNLASEKVYRVLEIGCGDSTLAETIYLRNPERIYYLGLDISPQVISSMKKKHQHLCAQGLGDMNESVPGLSFEVANILDINSEMCLPNSFNLIIDKGTSDTMQYRAPKDDCKILLNKLFTKVHDLLLPGGAYIIITPKYTVKSLRTTVSWDVNRVALKNCSEVALDNMSNKEVVYAHICTKNMETEESVASPQEWLTCPQCHKSRESMQLRGEKWRIHRKHCKGV